jgi:spermidine synthase
MAQEVPAAPEPESSPPAATLRFPEAFAFVESGCLLVLELVAGRLLAPTIGVSLYTWTSIIGVILGGVALGNWLGGRIADRHPTRGMLGLLLLLASGASLLVLGLMGIIDSLELPSSVPAIIQIVWLFGVLFFLPSAILGAVTPLLTRIAVHSVDSTGRVVGRIQAAAALGSIVGTFLTGFFLISWFGTRWIVAGVAGLLLLLAIAARPPWLKRAPAVALIVVLAGSTLAGGVLSDSGCTVETNYFCIRVNDTADSTGHNLKLMRLDSLVHGITDLDEPTRLVYSYELLYQQILNVMYPPGGRVDALLLGGGPYSLARYLDLTYTGQVLVAEIDPGVTAIARADFGVPAPGKTRIETVNDDARRVVAAMDPATTFDLVFGDAFNDFEVPYQLTTQEFARRVAAHLRPGGLYLLNLVDGVNYDFLRSELATLRTVFPYVGLVQRPEGWPPDGIRSTFVIVAGLRAPTVPLPTLSQPTLDSFVGGGQATILTDDFAPVDQLLAPVFQQALEQSGR